MKKQPNQPNQPKKVEVSKELLAQYSAPIKPLNLFERSTILLSDDADIKIIELIQSTKKD